MGVPIKLSLTTVFVVYILPLVHTGGGIQCQSCSSSPLQSPEQCNTSVAEVYCGNRRCFALTAELTNGTVVGIRGCYPSNAGECTNISACANSNQSLPAGLYFKRCQAECCTQERCNKNLFPKLPEMPSPTVKLMPSSSVATTGGITQATQDTTTPIPTSASVEMKASFYFLTFLMLMFKIMG